MLKSIKFLIVGTSIAAAASIPFIVKGVKSEKSLETKSNTLSFSPGSNGIPAADSPAAAAAKAAEEQAKLCDSLSRDSSNREEIPQPSNLLGSHTSGIPFPSSPCAHQMIRLQPN